MGAGKSTLGPEVARRLDRPFRDVDGELAAALDMPVGVFWAEHGEEAFRAREAALTLGALRAAEPSVGFHHAGKHSQLSNRSRQWSFN